MQLNQYLIMLTHRVFAKFPKCPSLRDMDLPRYKSPLSQPGDQRAFVAGSGAPSEEIVEKSVCVSHEFGSPAKVVTEPKCIA
jgi:hypothetical protein